MPAFPPILPYRPALALALPALALLAFAPALAAPAAKPAPRPARTPPPRLVKPLPAKPPGKTFALHGKVAPVIKGETLWFAFLGQVKHFDVLLETRTPAGKFQRYRTETDDRANFALKGIPAGKYLLRVRVPILPDEYPLGELYRGSYTVLPDDPPDREVALNIPFLVLRPTGADGELVPWESLEINLQRFGVAMDLNIQLRVSTQMGASPTGPVEEKGGVIVNINRVGASVSLGWTWGSKEKHIILFPLLEEDGLARYYFTVRRPAGEFGVGKFAGGRGEFPPQLELPIRNGMPVAGRVKLPPGAPAEPQRLTVSVLDPDDLASWHEEEVTAQPDGSFRSGPLPPGLVQVRGACSVGGENGLPRLFQGAVSLGAGERTREVEVVFQPAGTRELLPGELRVALQNARTGKPISNLNVLVIREDNPRTPLAFAIEPDGTSIASGLRAGAYRVRVLHPNGRGTLLEQTISEAEIRKGASRTLPVNPAP